MNLVQDIADITILYGKWYQSDRQPSKKLRHEAFQLCDRLIRERETLREHVRELVNALGCNDFTSAQALAENVRKLLVTTG